MQLPSIGAELILHPPRRNVATSAPAFYRQTTFRGDGVNLQGWRGDADGKRRGTLIYLHGIADNRASGAGVIERFRRRGFDVVAYDSRAHGESGGDACTYGYFEKQDLRAVIDSMREGPVVLVGSSLGAAVALQLAATDQRISAVIAAESFSDLRTIVIERAPFFFRSVAVQQAVELAERKGRFRIDAVSPTLAARTITVPVLVIHGAADSDTSPDHARRLFAALAGPKRLILTPNARHNESLHGGEIWEEIERWLNGVLPQPSDFHD
ncbi:MAG TPA: alpha/beta hydrolase [Chthoniobacteraceae bacterium]|nr:alpha/beta hydrolase [Chthoniobacteraceae bacterium]